MNVTEDELHPIPNGIFFIVEALKARTLDEHDPMLLGNDQQVKLRTILNFGKARELRAPRLPPLFETISMVRWDQSGETFFHKEVQYASCIRDQNAS